MSTIFISDVGPVIQRTLTDGTDALDISAATTKQIWFFAPSGALTKRTADFTTDGSDGNIQYAKLATDLNVAGEWGIRPMYIDPSGTYHGTYSRQTVQDEEKAE